MIKLADTLAPMSNDFYAVESENVGIDIDGTSKSIQQAYEDGDLSGDGSAIQVDLLPPPSVDELGKIYEFIGSTGTYVNGYFYECVSDEQNPPTYSWVQKNVQPNAESFTFNSDEFVVDSTTNEVSLKPSYADIPSFLPNNVSASNKLATSADLADKQDFRIFNSLEEFNEKKGTSLTVVSGIDNMKDIANAMSNGEILIIIVRYELGSEVYFGLTTSTGWTKMFTFIKSNGLCDVECRTTFPLTIKRVLNSDGVIGDWQELVTNDDIFRVGDRLNTIGWADLSNDVNIDGSSNYANNIGRVEGHNAIIKVSNPSIGYQWPVTNLGDRNNFMDFGGAIQFFTDKVNNHLYVRFENSVDMSAWGKVCTTTVEDVPITYINTFENETYVKPAMSNVCSYYVSNGNCIISIESVCLSTSTNFTQIISGLPKPKTTLYANAIDRTMSANSGARGLFQLTRNGDLNITCDYGDTSVVATRYFYVSFSYSVA